MINKRIVLLGGYDNSTQIVYNYLSNHYNIVRVIYDMPVDKKKFLKKRIKRLGLMKVIGQALFNLLVSKPMEGMSRSRIEEICEENGLSMAPIPKAIVTEGYSVNSDEVKQQLIDLNPDLIIVNGTRIISKKILSAVNCRFINTHSGITPKYRGVHGAYWALVNQDAENAGVTVHFIDEGIDTGDVISQARIKVGPQDNFTTYFTLQIAEGVKLLDKAIAGIFEGNLVCEKGTEESNIWTHPTLFQYIYNRLTKGVK